MAKTKFFSINLNEHIEASDIGDAIIEGYYEAFHGRIHGFSGDLMTDLKAHKIRQS